VYGSKDPDPYQNLTDPEHWHLYTVIPAHVLEGTAAVYCKKAKLKEKRMKRET
jgi:hypothetical protein